MKREIFTTNDGSVTIHLPEWDEQYHSKHGAINEAKHVFIQTGLDFCVAEKGHSKLDILEIGFGTGLNAFLSLLSSEKERLEIRYTGVEGYPIAAEEVSQLNYAPLLDANQDLFNRLHEVLWEVESTISEAFVLKKRKQLFKDISDIEAFDLIYYDAFGARVQPELWTEERFQTMFNALRDDGVLVTYAAKGSVRRAMQSVGFFVERLPGPPGKREMLRAQKRSTLHST